MSAKSASYWSTITVLSIADFKGDQAQDNVDEYRKLVNAGWGDIIIDNFEKDSVFFCTQKLGACYQMSYRMLRQALNADDILDYTDIRSYKAPFNRVTTVGRAITDGAVPISPAMEIEDKILDIVQGDN